MGYLAADGYLYVLDASKSLLIGNDGEKFSPEGIEEALIDQSPLIDRAMLTTTKTLHCRYDCTQYRNHQPFGRKAGNMPEALKAISRSNFFSKIIQYKKGGKC